MQSTEQLGRLAALVLALLLPAGCADSVSPHAEEIEARLAQVSEAEPVDVFTFDDPEAVGPWRIINDTVMGGRSSSRMDLTADGTGVFSGTVSLENNGGFAHTRSMAGPYDLSTYRGLALRVRGDGKRYDLTLKLDRSFDGVIYQTGFVAPASTWTEVRLPFADFVPTYHGERVTDRPPLDPAKIRTIGFIISDKQEGPFRLEVDWIRAYGEG
jgi:monofunctional biosynthetic peptidoglycan transglycosylase